MPDTNKHPDPLPDEFGSYEQAGEFWDTHSITDYKESLEPAELDVDIRRRHFEIEVDEESFLAVRTIWMVETATRTTKFITMYPDRR
jgi:hypothetical protein